MFLLLCCAIRRLVLLACSQDLQVDYIPAVRLRCCRTSLSLSGQHHDIAPLPFETKRTEYLNADKKGLSENEMSPDIYRVKNIGSGFLAIMAKPMSGDYIEDEFSGIARADVKQIVSLLESDEEYTVGLRREEELSKANGMRYQSYPIPDRDIPVSLEKFCLFIDTMYVQIYEGLNTVVHCRSGIGRAGIVVVSVLIRSGVEPNVAFDLVSEKRGVAVPHTEEQKKWVFANHRLIANIE